MQYARPTQTGFSFATIPEPAVRQEKTAMFAVRRSLSALTFAGVLAAAAPVSAADEPIATANKSAPPAAAAQPAAAGQAAVQADPGVAAQIDDYLKTSPAIELPRDGGAAGITSSEEPRKVHGVVDVAVGTHGYRSAYVRSDFPVGKTGTLSIAVEDSQFKSRGGYGYGGYGGAYSDQTYRNQNLALGLAFGGAAQSGDPRCRDSGMTRHRIDPMLTGPGPGDRPYDCDRMGQPAPERPLD
jgi:hypothetical protein